MKHILIAALAVVSLAGCGVAHASTPGKTAVCDPTAVSTFPNGRNGVAVIVHANGPDVVVLDVNGAEKIDHRHYQQQVTKNDVGAEFALDGLTAYSITVTTRNRGACLAQIPHVGW